MDCLRVDGFSRTKHMLNGKDCFLLVLALCVLYTRSCQGLWLFFSKKQRHEIAQTGSFTSPQRFSPTELKLRSLVTSPDKNQHSYVILLRHYLWLWRVFKGDNGRMPCLHKKLYVGTFSNAIKLSPVSNPFHEYLFSPISPFHAEHTFVMIENKLIRYPHRQGMKYTDVPK